jgi:Beta-propeller domains of methanol dehydrogenase type
VSMMRWKPAVILLLAAVVAVLSFGGSANASAPEAKPKPKKLIYDAAKLLEKDTAALLESMAREYGAKVETDIVIYTTNNTSNRDVVELTQDFYDKYAFGYDKPHGNTVILTLDMKNRDVYLAGFYKAKEYLDDGRLDKIRNKITPDLSGGYYYSAFSDYIKLSHRYMGYEPGVNPDNILFKWWFQFAVAAVIALIVVGRMRAVAGGKVTVHRGTYENGAASGIRAQSDQYIRTTVTKQHVPRPSDGGGGSGGGGGGVTRGGHSHSGSRGKF